MTNAPCLSIALILFAAMQTSEDLPSSTGIQATTSNGDQQVGEFVVAAFQDSQGNLWFGTVAKGVARYDGTTLTYYSTQDGLAGDTVAGIAEDKQGHIWFGTHTGASKFDGKSFTNFGSREGLHGAGCQFLVDAEGNIWAGTNHGVFRYDGTSFVEFEIPKPAMENLSYKWEPGKVWCLMQDSKGHMWFGRDGFGVCRYDGTRFTHFTKDDGLGSNNVSQIAEDHHGNIWFGSLTSDKPDYVKEGGVSRYDGQRFVSFPDVEGISRNDIYTIFVDSRGNVWIGATGIGVYRYDGTNFTLIKETDRNDLTRNFGLQAMMEDKHGTLWFGFSGGLFRFNGTSLENVTQDGPWK